MSVDWFAPEARCRVKLDAFGINRGVGHAVDFKTGKERDRHHLQLELYGLAGLLRYADLTVVEAELWYLDTGNVVAQTFKRDEVVGLRARWEKRTRKMLQDRRFAPTPGPACRWCSFSARRGGPCEFGA
jgi:hypothetical protein